VGEGHGHIHGKSEALMVTSVHSWFSSGEEYSGSERDSILSGVQKEKQLGSRLGQYSAGRGAHTLPHGGSPGSDF
jgi:hypothetical protein